VAVVDGHRNAEVLRDGGDEGVSAVDDAEDRDVELRVVGEDGAQLIPLLRVDRPEVPGFQLPQLFELAQLQGEVAQRSS
jgi:hypothetical protein